MSYSSISEKLYLTFILKNCRQNTFYKISALIEDSQSKYNENIETEKKQCFQNNSLILFSQKMLCNFYFERNQPVKIQITKKNDDGEGIIERMTVLSSLISSPNSIYERKINNEENSEILCIKLDRENMNFDENNISLFEYFKSGLKLSCFISLDFSNIKLSPSLIDTKINYVKLLKNISIIFSNYTKNHLFYTYGFGANFLSDKEIFNINLKKNDSKINTINEVLKYFKLCLISKFIKGENHIYLSSLIKKITKQISKLNEIKNYNIQFIIIRGVIEKNDVEKTIDAIIESSLLPLTIFIIGVGANDYSQMNNIFSFNNKFSSTGIEKKRNNVFFISLIQNFSNDAEKLISWCAEELTKQIFNYYYDLNKTTPKDVYEKNLKNIESSFNLYNRSFNTSFFKNKNPYNPYNRKEKKSSIDKYKEEENPNKKNISLNNSSKNSNNSNNIEPKISNDSYNYIIRKPKMYDNNSENDNNKNNNIDNNKNRTFEENGEDMFTPGLEDKDSVCPKIVGNPYCEKNESKEENKPEKQEFKNNNNSPEKKYNIPNHSISSFNLNNNYNPYKRDRNNNINGKIEQSNNYNNYNPCLKNYNNENIEQRNSYSYYNPYLEDNKKQMNENIEQRNSCSYYNPYLEDKKKQINEDIEQSNIFDNNYTPYSEGKVNQTYEDKEQSNNYDNNYNPYLEDRNNKINENIEQSNNYNNYNHYLEDNKNKINENNKQNNNLIKHNKNYKNSIASELNSTKNSENVKSSNFFLFNNYSIDKSNMK